MAASNGRLYFGLVHREPGHARGVSFPDLPGCFAAADEDAGVLEAAKTALRLHAQDKDTLPEPRSMAQLQADPSVLADLGTGATLLAVPLLAVERKASYNVMQHVETLARMHPQAPTAGTSGLQLWPDAVKSKLAATAGAAIIYRNNKTYAVKQGATGKKPTAKKK
jgi:predicted RNase H-like HicB family nuclease